MEFDQAGEGRGGPGGALHHAPAAVEQVLADAEQQGAEDGLLAGEVAVDGGPADSGRGAKVLQRHPVKTVGGKEGGGRGEQRLAAVLLGLASLGGLADSVTGAPSRLFSI